MWVGGGILLPFHTLLLLWGGLPFNFFWLLVPESSLYGAELGCL